MPLPILHSFAGYQIYKLSLDKEEAKSWKMAALFMTLANFADLDMLPGMLFGNPDMFHRSLTHSLGAAVLVSFLVAALVKWLKKISFTKIFLVGMNAYFSHVLLDYITGSVRFMLWPLRVSVKPMTITALFDHQNHPLVDCAGLGEFCKMLVSPSLMLRLFSEAVLVFLLIKTIKIFSKSRTLHPSSSDSPSLVAGLAIFIFIVTALMATQAAG